MIPKGNKGMESPENRGFGVLSVALTDHGPEFFAKKYRHAAVSCRIIDQALISRLLFRDGSAFPFFLGCCSYASLRYFPI